MAKKRKKTKAKKSKKAKRASLARKKKTLKNSVRQTKKKWPFLPKPTPAPLVPPPPALPEQPLMFGGFFGTKTDGQ